jgi:hypothetical protein
MGVKRSGGIIALAIACGIAGCGSSHGTTRTSLIDAEAPTTARTAGPLALGEKVPLTKSGKAPSTLTTITAPQVTTQSTTETTTTASSVPTGPIPLTGPLSAGKFEEAANKICEYIDVKARSVGGAGTSASLSAETKLDALELVSQEALSQLLALAPRGPASSQKRAAAFVKYVREQDAIGAKAAGDAGAGAQSSYTKELGQLSTIAEPVIDAGRALAPACAQG